LTKEEEDRFNELGMMRKEDLSLGQLFEFARSCPDELDGVVFEQKLNKTISEEFIRLQANVESGFQ
jgi:hypothetical protein